LRLTLGELPWVAECTVAHTGEEALAAARRAAPDVALVDLRPSGYVVMRPSERLHVVADVGPPCPPDLPAHAHADCLSFELAVDGQRVIVDTGVSTYDPGSRRAFERSTPAHNTVAIDDQDQTEVWGVFRAARLAQPRIEAVTVEDGRVELTASHDGYERLPGRPRHRRTWRASADRLELVDEVVGAGVHRVTARLHVAPKLRVEHRDDGSVTAGPLRVSIDPAVRVNIEPGEVATGFGRRQRDDVVVVSTEGRLPLAISTTVTIDAALGVERALTIRGVQPEGVS
jgi:uncharacterized heparinase superfamily protein